MTGRPKEPAATGPRPLPDATVTKQLATLPGWRREGGWLVREAELPSFREAIRVVTRVAGEAEAMDHHPDIVISFKRLTFRLQSHDAGGITSRDFRLAARIEAALAGAAG